MVLAGVVTAVLFNVVYISWMKEYKHPLALSGGIFGELVFFMGAVLVTFALVRGLRSGRYPGPLTPLLLVAGWLTVDYVKTIGFLGFPWGILGYSQYENLPLIQTASLFGVWGVDFIMLYANALAAVGLVMWMERGRMCSRSLLYHAAALSVLVAASLVFGYIQLGNSTERDKTIRARTPSLSIAMIQGNFDPWSPRLEENLATQMSLTRQALGENPDLVVWSESSVPLYYRYHLNKGNRHAQSVHRFAVSLPAPLIFGTIDVQENPAGEFDFFNVAACYSDGRMGPLYRKIHLVPFGEWFPYERIFPFVKRILEEAGAGDFTPGTEYTLFQIDGHLFNVLICYEDVFGNLARKFVLLGSDLMVNVTNDAWTGSPKAEIQHYSKSVYRAIENRRSLVRAANGGVTAAISPWGEQLGAIDLFRAGYLVSRVPVITEPHTLYTRAGDLLAWVVVAVTLVLLPVVLIRFLYRKQGAGRRAP